ncbi:MAG: hypothetical protein ACYTG0_22885 [Planctomycetota bacterium]|jgi:uncharacterized protein with PIN domain
MKTLKHYGEYMTTSSSDNLLRIADALERLAGHFCPQVDHTDRCPHCDALIPVTTPWQDEKQGAFVVCPNCHERVFLPD